MLQRGAEVGDHGERFIPLSNTRGRKMAQFCNVPKEKLRNRSFLKNHTYSSVTPFFPYSKSCIIFFPIHTDVFLCFVPAETTVFAL